MKENIKTIEAVQCQSCKKLISSKGYYIFLDYRAGKREGDNIKECIGAGDNVVYCHVSCLAEHMATVYGQILH